MTILEQVLLALSLMGLVVDIGIAIVLWHWRNDMRAPRYVPIVIPASKPVLAQVPALGLRGGAIEFTLPDGQRTVVDMNSDQTFAAMAGIRMIATFQEAE